MKIKNLLSILVLAFLMIGCEEKLDSNIISSGAKNTQEQLDALQNVDKNSYKEVADVFFETQKITTKDNKPYFLVFAANGCIYCDKLKELIRDDSRVKTILQNSYSPYYINLSYSKSHSVDFLKDAQETSELARLYNIKPTPTLVFVSPHGKTLFVYPGYMPKERFLATLEFIKSQNSDNKDEKEIAKELQELFQTQNI